MRIIYFIARALSKYTVVQARDVRAPRNHFAGDPRARRSRRAATYEDSEPDDDDDEDLELAPPDDEDGWD